MPIIHHERQKANEAENGLSPYDLPRFTYEMQILFVAAQGNIRVNS